MSAVVSTSKEKKSKTKEKSTKDKRKEKKQNSIPDQISDSSDSDSEPVNGQTPATSNNSHVPPGAILLDNVLSAEEFDYDRLKDDDDLELCVIRLPNGVKAKSLSGMQATLMSKSALDRTTRIGALSKKSGEAFDLWNIHPESESTDPNGGALVGGDELINLTCLVPSRSRGGKLFAAPKPIKHHLLLTSRSTTPPSLPTNTPTPSSESLYKSPARYRHPKNLLKHRFLPTGATYVPNSDAARSILPDKKNSMEVDSNNPQNGTDEATQEKAETKRREKKRKAEGDSGKSKKAKTTPSQ